MDIKVDDLVVYRSAGVCRVISKEEQCMDGVHYQDYIKLKPLADPNSTYYIPSDGAEDKLRWLLDREQVLELIDTMPNGSEDELWSDNRRERKMLYSQILRGDDQKALVQLISELYFKKQDQQARGKRFSTMDENAMKNAESLMLQEFGIVLGMEPDQVRDFIAERVNA